MRNYSFGLLSFFIIISWISGTNSHSAQIKLSGDLEAKGDLILKGTLQPLVFPDGSVQTKAHPPYFSTVIVSPGTTATESGANLIAAIAKITDASAAKRYLIKIEPGIYNVGTGSVIMKDYVDIEGSGENVTRIQGAPDARYNLGVLNGASNTSLRLLTVEHKGGIEHATAIINISAAATIERVSVIAAAIESACGIEHRSSELVLSQVSLSVSSDRTATGIIAQNSDLKINDFTITATSSSGRSSAMRIDNSLFKIVRGNVNTSSSDSSFAFSIDGSSGGIADVTISSSGTGYENIGILTYSSEFSISGVQAEVSGAQTNNGISAKESSLTVKNSIIRASGGTYSRGIANSSSSLTITSGIVEGEGGSTINVGILISEGPNNIIALYSTFRGATKSIGSQTGWTFDLAGCKLDGPLSTGIGTWRCASCYNGSYAPLNSACNP